MSFQETFSMNFLLVMSHHFLQNLCCYHQSQNPWHSLSSLLFLLSTERSIPLLSLHVLWLRCVHWQFSQTITFLEYGFCQSACLRTLLITCWLFRQLDHSSWSSSCWILPNSFYSFLSLGLSLSAQASQHFAFFIAVTPYMKLNLLSSCYLSTTSQALDVTSL